MIVGPIAPWLESLDTASFADVEAGIQKERDRRNQEQQAAAPVDGTGNVDTQITALRNQWAMEAERKAREAEEAWRKRRLKIRSELQEGKIVAEHVRQCDLCMRAILSLNPESACSEGRESYPHFFN